MAVDAPGVLGQGSAASSGTAPSTATAEVKVPAFDVVSIKPNKSGSGGIRIMNKPDGYSASNISLKMLIQGAYGIREDLISGAPGWADSARYDIDAKVAGVDVDALKKLTPEQRRSILQPLLAERFKLKVHTETKQLPVYELVVAKGGSKLKEATPDDTYATGIKGPDGVGRGGMMRMGRGQLTAQGIRMTSLVNMLSQQLHRTVIDKTGLTGKYDLDLNWTPEEGEMGPPPPGGSQPRADGAAESAGPSIYTAVQEQLGLKLQAAKGPVDTLVIDHVEMPSEN
ncbi:MAG: TIGR03435 family protein [Edaphobacter sp.]